MAGKRSNAPNTKIRDGGRPYTSTGFYDIGRLTNRTILFGFLDYGQKQGGVGQWFYPTGNVDEYMEMIQALYAQFKGKYPEAQYSA